MQHLGEDQGRAGTSARGARGRAATVEVPVPQCEGDDVREPDGGATGQQHLGVLGEVGHVDDAHHEPDGRTRVRDGDQPDDHAGQVVEPRAVAVDAAGVPDDQRSQQDDEEDQEDPGGVAVAQLVRQRRPEEARGDDGERHRPPGLADARLLGLARRLGVDRHAAIFPQGRGRAGLPVPSGRHLVPWRQSPTWW